jgi:hypothetical protein
MNAIPFLRDLRALLTPSTAWHPLACANREGFVLGEYAQSIPGRTPGTYDGPTWNIPVRWNLPCAITFLLGAWANAGHFADVPVDRTAMKLAVYGLLEAEARGDLWLVRDHGQALAAIDGVLASFADRSAA